jgi:Tfp pilus assembly protein PilN
MSKTWTLVIIFLAIMAVLFTYLFIFQSRELNSEQDENANLKTAINSCENEMTGYQPIQALEQEMLIKSDEVAALNKNRVSYAGVMNELDKVSPPPIIIVEAEITPPKLTVNGFSPDYGNLIKMLEGIEVSPIFTRVALLSSEINENTNEVKFTLEIEMEAIQK